MNNFEFTETPFFFWKDKKATLKQIKYIKEMWEFSNYSFPSLDLETLTKGVKHE